MHFSLVQGLRRSFARTKGNRGNHLRLNALLDLPVQSEPGVLENIWIKDSKTQAQQACRCATKKNPPQKKEAQTTTPLSFKLHHMRSTNSMIATVILYIYLPVTQYNTILERLYLCIKTHYRNSKCGKKEYKPMQSIESNPSPRSVGQKPTSLEQKGLCKQVYSTRE